MRFYPNGLNVKDYDEYEGGRSVEELRSYVKNLV
jgi:hypothetical protein